MATGNAKRRRQHEPRNRQRRNRVWLDSQQPHQRSLYIAKIVQHVVIVRNAVDLVGQEAWVVDEKPEGPDDIVNAHKVHGPASKQ